MPTRYVLGLVGYPVEHSLSPRLHAAALKSTGLEGEYCLYPAPPAPEGISMIQSLLERMRRGEIQGLNLTIPHKRTALTLVDRLTPTAEAVGAANTIYLKDGRLIGDNTDVEGFWSDLCRQLAVGGTLSKSGPANALVLGAGGSARAVVYALIQGGWSVQVAARRLEQAEEMAGALQARPGPAGGKSTSHPGELNRVSSLSLTPEALSVLLSRMQVQLVVNTTPLGMGEHSNECPWPLEVPLPGGAFVYDLVYNPPETRLLSAARSAGRAVANGLGMLIEQAALSFLAWTGISPSRVALHEAVASSWSGKGYNNENEVT